MPVIVVFGDSNTWGSDPATGARFSRAQRWPTVMQRELGPEFDVIAEGLRGRTTVHDDPIEPFRSGADALPPCLMSHAPVDLVILALGCNDLKKRFSVSAFDIAEGAARLIFLVRAYGEDPDGGAPRILLVAPPPLAKLTGYAEMFEGGTEKSRLIGQRFGEIAKQGALRSSTPAPSFAARTSTASTTKPTSTPCWDARRRRRFAARSPRPSSRAAA
jgi:lysophospholipase L1-like esterase